MSVREFTPEQADAIARRSGPLLLSANAGSGKTSVLVERFVRMVLDDGLEPGQVLAITFTDKAAGELRARVRTRFAELGARDRARDLESAWILTFHGFCARVLRAHAIAAGLDPGFRVLEEAEARAARAQAFDTALAAFLDPAAGRHAEALDLVAAYGADPLQAQVVAAHDRLRSQGQTRPSLPVPPPPPDRDELRFALRRACAEALDELPADDQRKTVAAARAKVERCAALLDDPAAALEDLDFTVGRTAVLQGVAVDRYLTALKACVQADADGRAIAALGLLDVLLGGYADAYAAAKREQGALDFDDLELLARDVLRSSLAVAAAYRERFARIMVDEFQDTNHVQLDLLRLLDAGHTFVVGDELQSIYGFRHADVGIFRSERARLGAQGDAATLATNFRSRPAILEVLDAAFGEGHGEGYVPFVAGRRPSDEGHPPAPRVELLLTDAEPWCADGAPDVSGVLPAAPAWRHAEARLVAQRVADLVREEGVPAGDVVLLLRSATDMAVFERALEEQGIATLAAGGRGYWGREQVLDLCAYLGTLANPRDEAALFGVLASPLVGLSSTGLALVAAAAPKGRRWDALSRAFCGGEEGAEEVAAPAAPAAPLADDDWLAGLDVPTPADLEEDPALGASSRAPLAPARPAGQDPLDDLDPADRDHLAAFCTWFARERERAPRMGLDELLARAVARTGYDLHVLGLPGGRRRLANVHKLQRLAAAFEARHGRDVRGLIDRATAELEAEAREADAPVELQGEQAVRLMTMHAAKGLEFPVVVVADLGRKGNTIAPDLLLHEGRAALRLRRIDGGREDALGWGDLRTALLEHEASEERRILHVAMTRAEERLVLSGAATLADEWKPPTPGAEPLRWIAPGLVGGSVLEEVAAPDGPAELPADPEPGRADPRVRVLVSRPHGPSALRPDSVAPLALAVVAAEGTGRPVEEPVAEEPTGQLALDFGAPAPPPPTPLPSPTPPVPIAAEAPAAPPVATLSYSSLTRYGQCGYRFYLERVLRLPEEDVGPAQAAAAAPEGMERRLRGSVVHELLEDLDFAAPEPPPAERVRELLARLGEEAPDEHVEDVRRLVAAVAEGPVAARLAAATGLRREQAFAFPLGDPAATLVNGVVDVIATAADGTALVVDWKTDDVDDADLEELVATSYGAQRRIYALAALHAGAPCVEVAHVFLNRPDEPAVATYDAADRDRLSAELRAAAGDLLAGRFPVTDAPHRDLCLTCPGRRALCYHPEELTLREHPGAPPQPVPAAPSA